MRPIHRLISLVLVALVLVGCMDGATAPDEVAVTDGYLTASLGGDSWEASPWSLRDDMSNARLDSGAQTISIFGTSYDPYSDETSMADLSLGEIPARVGTFDIVAYDGFSRNLDAFVFVKPGGPLSSDSYDYYSVSGSVTVTRFDQEARVVAGTFSIDCIGYHHPEATPIDGMSVRDGRFRLHF